MARRHITDISDDLKKDRVEHTGFGVVLLKGEKYDI